jgi:hypothetical protein
MHAQRRRCRTTREAGGVQQEAEVLVHDAGDAASPTTIAVGAAFGRHVGDVQRARQQSRICAIWGAGCLAFDTCDFFGVDLLSTLESAERVLGLLRQADLLVDTGRGSTQFVLEVGHDTLVRGFVDLGVTEVSVAGRFKARGVILGRVGVLSDKLAEGR